MATLIVTVCVKQNTVFRTWIEIVGIRTIKYPFHKIGYGLDVAAPGILGDAGRQLRRLATVATATPYPKPHLEWAFRSVGFLIFPAPHFFFGSGFPPQFGREHLSPGKNSHKRSRGMINPGTGNFPPVLLPVFIYSFRGMMALIGVPEGVRHQRKLSRPFLFTDSRKQTSSQTNRNV